MCLAPRNHLCLTPWKHVRSLQYRNYTGARAPFQVSWHQSFNIHETIMYKMLLAQQLPPSPGSMASTRPQSRKQKKHKKKAKECKRPHDLSKPAALCVLFSVWKHLERNMFLGPSIKIRPLLFFCCRFMSLSECEEGPGHDYLYSGSLVGYGTLGHSASKGMRAAFWSGSTGGTLNMFTSTSSKVLPLAFGLTKCFQRRRYYVICDWLVTLGVTACVVLQLVGLYMLLGSIHTLT